MYVTDLRRGEVIDPETGEVIEERIPIPEMDYHVRMSSRINPTQVNWGYGITLGAGLNNTIRLLTPDDFSLIESRKRLDRALSLLPLNHQAKAKMIEEVLHLYRQLVNMGLSRNNKQAIALAALLIKLSHYRFPILPEEKKMIMHDIFKVSTHQANKTLFRIISRTGIRYYPPVAESYVRRFCEAPEEICRKALEIVRKLNIRTPVCRAMVALLEATHNTKHYGKILQSAKEVCPSAPQLHRNMHKSRSRNGSTHPE